MSRTGSVRFVVRASQLVGPALIVAGMLFGVTTYSVERVALVVGNAHYRHNTPLANPVNDAVDIATMLRGLDFDVIVATDLDRAGLFDRIGVFHEKARRAAVGVFFYAGHALHMDGANYLVPVDVRLERRLDVKQRAIELNDVISGMSSSVNMVFLDACRNNPLAAPLARSIGLSRDAAAVRGLAVVRRGTETLIAYATAPGEVAAEGTGRNSPFTTALIEHLDTPGLSVNDILTRVKRSVRDATGDRQRPWTHDSLSSIFYFLPETSVDSVPAISGRTTGASDPDPAAEMWKVVWDSGKPALVQEFLKRHKRKCVRACGPSAVGRVAPPFTVNVEPTEARVRLLDGVDDYRPGMALPLGEHELEVSAEEYESAREPLIYSPEPRIM